MKACFAPDCFGAKLDNLERQISDYNFDDAKQINIKQTARISPLQRQ